MRSTCLGAPSQAVSMSARKQEGARAEKRARILGAALEVCARDGVERARMEEVAALAGVSKGTLYNFFESKQDLLLATLIDSYEESLRIVDEPDSRQGDPRAELEGLLESLGVILEAVAPRMNVHYQAWGLIARDPERRERLFKFLRDFFATRREEIERILRDGQRLGVFRAEFDVDGVVSAILALLSGFLYHSTFDGSRASPKNLAATFDAVVRDVVYVDAGARRVERGR